MESLGDKIRALRAEGKNYSQIMSALSCSKSTVSYHLNPNVKKAALAASIRVKKERLNKLNELKESKPCTDCGKFFKAFLMDFDHLPGSLKIQRIGYLVKSSSWKVIEAELAKCELVCCMCHRIRTQERWLANPLAQ